MTPISCTPSDLFVLLCAVLVLGLFIGITLIYSGAAQYKNSVSILTQSLLLFTGLYLLWQLDFFSSLYPQVDSSCNSTIAQLFQFLFLAIACISFIGSTIERTKPLPLLIFSLLWSVVVYLPIAYNIWNEAGLLKQLGVVDFAGGLVVHLSAGATGLTLAYLIGRRDSFFSLRKPANLIMVFLGNFLVLAGWLGFNAGSSGTLDNSSMQIILNTLLAGTTGIAIWAALELIQTPHRIHFTHLSLGLIAGLVAITSKVHLLNSLQSLLIAAAAVIGAFYCSKLINKAFKVDDAMDVFSTHGAASIIGGVLATVATQASLLAETGALIAVSSYSTIMTFIIYKLLNRICKFRVSTDIERNGLDLEIHGEKLHNEN